MAKKLEHLHLEIAHFENFKQYLNSYENMCQYTLRNLLQNGLIEVSTSFEQALSSVSGFKVIGADACDLADGSDAKLSTVRLHSKGKSYTAPVANIKSKSGSLRIQVYERHRGKFYYFVIPYWAHCMVGNKSNIEIPFDLTGKPKRNYNTRGKLPNWWNFEVNNFRTLALLKRF